MAMIGFKGFGWLLGLATVSPACYLVSSQVAAERSRVEAVERAIIQTRRDIRGLQTEFGTRANYSQLERWNGDVLALASPRADQYVQGEAALASLDPAGARVRSAALIVPAAVSAPVATADAAVRSPGGAAEASAPVAAAAPARPAAPRTQIVAMLDRDLLSDATMGELANRARGETAIR